MEAPAAGDRGGQNNWRESMAQAKRRPAARTHGAEDRRLLIKAAQLEKCRSSLWEFNKYRNPGFFREDRTHLKELSSVLQGIYDGTLFNPRTGKSYRKLMINIGPRMGKSYTMSGFEQWALGKKRDNRIISVSYNEILSTRFGKGVRDGISETKIDPEYPIFADVFPDVRIKDGDAASQIWALEGSYFSFLSAGFGGTITGVGANIGVIDDPIKNHIEANNEAVLDGQWQWYTDTFLSRIEEGGIIIIIMTRWATKDLCGRLLETEGDEWYVFKRACCLDEPRREMLCPGLMSWERYDALRKLTSPAIMLANYQQEPIDLQGRLYERFTTYKADELPKGRIVSYTDTADTGADFLCCLIAVVHAGQGYVIDIVYTDERMERTERQVAKALYDARCGDAIIESNNGGRAFARNVRRILWEEYGWRRTQIIDHNQRQNKQARILTEAGYIQDNILFPEDWRERWSAYARAMESYQRKGKNAHDDAPDATTGLAETIQGGLRRRTKFYSGRGAR